MNESSHCSTSSISSCVLGFGHSDRCVVLPCFNLCFPGSIDVEHLVTCLFAICALLVVSVELFGPVLNWVLCWVLHVSRILVFYQPCFFGYFIPACGLSSYYVDSLLHRAEIVNVNETEASQFFLSWQEPLLLYRNHYY